MAQRNFFEGLLNPAVGEFPPSTTVPLDWEERLTTSLPVNTARGEHQLSAEDIEQARARLSPRAFGYLVGTNPLHARQEGVERQHPQGERLPSPDDRSEEIYLTQTEFRQLTGSNALRIMQEEIERKYPEEGNASLSGIMGPAYKGRMARRAERQRGLAVVFERRKLTHTIEKQEFAKRKPNSKQQRRRKRTEIIDRRGLRMLSPGQMKAAKVQGKCGNDESADESDHTTDEENDTESDDDWIYTACFKLEKDPELKKPENKKPENKEPEQKMTKQANDQSQTGNPFLDERFRLRPDPGVRTVESEFAAGGAFDDDDTFMKDVLGDIVREDHWDYLHHSGRYDPSADN